MEQESLLADAEAVQKSFQAIQLKLVQNAAQFDSPPEGSDLEDIENRDPSIIAENVKDQIASFSVWLRDFWLSNVSF